MNWRKATGSFANGNCVQVADIDRSVMVRDSADPASPVFSFTPRAWAAFTAWLTLRRDARQLHAFIPYQTPAWPAGPASVSGPANPVRAGHAGTPATCPLTLAGQVADQIARDLAGQPPWTPVTSDVRLGVELNVSHSTVGKAKQLLARQGIIVKQHRVYYVAPARGQAGLAGHRTRAAHPRLASRAARGEGDLPRLPR